MKRFALEGARATCRSFYTFYCGQFPKNLCEVSCDDFYQKLEELNQACEDGSLKHMFSCNRDALLPYSSSLPAAYQEWTVNKYTYQYLCEQLTNDIQISLALCRKHRTGRWPSASELRPQEQQAVHMAMNFGGAVGYWLWEDIQLQQEAERGGAALRALTSGSENTAFLTSMLEDLAWFDTHTEARLAELLESTFSPGERAQQDATLYRLIQSGAVAAEYLPCVDSDYQEVISDNPLFRDLTITDATAPAGRASSQVVEKPLVEAIEDLEEDKGLMSKKEHQELQEERKHAFSVLAGLGPRWPEQLRQVEKMVERGTQSDNRIRSIQLVFILLLLAVGLGALTVYCYRSPGTPSDSVVAVINIISVIAGFSLLVTIHGIGGLIVGVIVSVALNLLLTKVFIELLHLDEHLPIVFFALTVLVLLFALVALWNAIRLASVKKLSKSEEETLHTNIGQCMLVSLRLNSYLEIFHWNDPWLQARAKEFQERYETVEKLLAPGKKE